MIAHSIFLFFVVLLLLLLPLPLLPPLPPPPPPLLFASSFAYELSKQGVVYIIKWHGENSEPNGKKKERLLCVCAYKQWAHWSAVVLFCSQSKQISVWMCVIHTFLVSLYEKKNCGFALDTWTKSCPNLCASPSTHTK